MVFRNSSRRNKNEQANRRESRRRRLNHWISRKPRVESLEDRRLLAVDIALDGDTEVAILGDIGGTSDDSVIIGVENNLLFHNLLEDNIEGDGDYADKFDWDPGEGELNISIDPALDQPALNVQLGDGSDTLTLEGLTFTNITYDGGAGDDALVLTGDATGAEGSYETQVSPDPTTGFSGRIFYQLGARSQDLEFSNLEPVEDLMVASSLSIVDAGGGNEMNLVAGPLSTTNDPITGSQEDTHQVNFGAQPFELINFRNKTSVTVDGVGGNDDINIDQVDVGDGLTNIDVVGGIGEDTITVDDATVDSLEVFGGLDPDNIEVNDTNAAFTLIDGEENEDTITINDASGDELSVDGGEDGDAIDVNDTNATLTQVDGGLDVDTITIVNAHGDELVIDGGGAGDIIDVTDTNAITTEILGGPDDGADTITISNANGEGTAGDELTVDGQGGNDAITLVNTNTFGETSLLGGTGEDDIEVFDANSDVLTVDGEGDNDTITLFDSNAISETTILGGGNNDTIIIEDAQSPTLTVDAGTGDDLVQLVDSNAGQNSFAGGDDIDILEYPGAGTKTLTGIGSGEIVGDPDVDFEEFEYVLAAGVLDDVIDISAFPGGEDGLANEILIESTFDNFIGEDVVVVSFRSGPGEPLLVVGSQIRDNVGTIEVIGGSDDDTLTIDLANDLLSHVNAGDVNFDGAGGSDLLEIIDSAGGSLTDLYYTPDPSLGVDNAGTVLLDSTRTITFTGLEPVIVTAVPDTVTVDISALPASESLTFANDGGTVGNSQVTFTNNPAEDLSFANPTTSLTLIANDNGNEVTMNAMDAAFDAVVTLGGGAGVDTYNINATTGTQLHTINSGASNDTIIVGGPGSLDAINAPLTVNGEDNAVDPTRTSDVTAKGSNVSVTLSIGDTLQVNDTADATGNTYTINDGTVDRVGAALISYTGIESLDVLGSDAGDNIIDVVDTTDGIYTRIQGGNAGGGDDIEVTTTGDGSIVNIAGFDGADVILITTTGASSVTIVDGNDGGDTLAMLTSSPGSGVALLGGPGNDGVFVENTGDGSLTLIDGGSDSDEVFVRRTGTASLMDIFGGGGNDEIFIGNDDPNVGTSLDEILGEICVFGDGGVDDLNISDEFDTDDNNYLIRPTFVERTNAAPVVQIDYDSIENLALRGGIGSDKFVAEPSPTTAYIFDGNLPSGSYGSTPGDTLSVNTVGFGPINAPFQQTAGVISSAAPSATFTPITFTDFEWVVLPDRFEFNDNAGNFPNPDIADLSTKLGSLPAITLNGLSIHGPDDPATTWVVEDVDYYQYVAHDTGKLVIRSLFEHEFGDLEMSVFDADGNLIAASNSSADNQDFEEIIIPVVGQEVYYIQVNGVSTPDDDCNVNNYDLEIENFAAPQPEVDLVDASDSGSSLQDEYTNDTTPTIAVQADLSAWLMGIPVDGGAGTPGAEVVVAATDQNSGAVITVFADRVDAGTPNNNLWSATLPALGDGNYFVEAWVRIEDGQGTPAIGRSIFSEPLPVTIDGTDPAEVTNLDLLTASDTGTSNTDDLTSIMQPAFTGSNVEPYNTVRLFANNEQVGETVADVAGNWEITSEPLADGQYEITAEQEDLAGNVSPIVGQPLIVTIDAEGPQRPTIDLINTDDSGMSRFDNVTSGETGADGIADFRIQGVPGESLRIKDGDIEIQQSAAVSYANNVPAIVFDANGNPIIPADGDLEIRIDFNALAADTGYPVEGPHPLSTELYDLAGNRGAQAEELLVEIDFTAPVTPTIVLEASSDTGTAGDGITSISQPTFTGFAEPNSKIHLFDASNGELIGSGVTNTAGVWQVQVNTLRNDDYTVSVVSEDLAGNVSLDASFDIIVDPFEPNDTIAAANELGSPETLTLNNLVLHNSDDVDVFEYTAHTTGKLLAFAISRTGETVELEFRDAADNVIPSTNGVIPVVSQENYFLVISSDVQGFDRAVYDLEIENFAAPQPDKPLLAPGSDTGTLLNDNITNNPTPTYYITADLADFALMGVPVDQGVGTPGAEVILGFTNTTTGIRTDVQADRVINTNNSFWSATPGAALDDGVYLVQAWTRIEDGQGTPAVGRSQLTAPMLLTIDTIAPNVDVPDLLDSSDTGMFDDDNVTSKMSPAFSGTAEPNALVRILANGAIVGQSVATTDGRWEITTEPLRDGTYAITAQAEDAAGNQTTSEPITIWVDTTDPNFPQLDLLSDSDSGLSGTDDVTSDNTPDVSLTINDTVDGGDNPFPNDLKYRIFVRPDGDLALSEVLLVDSTAGVTDPADIFTTVGFHTHTLTLPNGAPLPDGVHDLKLVVEDRAGNLNERTLTIEIDTVTPAATIDLIDSSDSGMFDDDDVTNISQPAFAGISEVGATVTILAQPLDSTGAPIGDIVPVGVGTVGSDETDLVPDDGQGAWEVTVEPLDDGRYTIIAHIEDLAGNFSQATMEIWVDTTDPNFPQIDLLSDSDSGISTTDNVTFDNTPDVSVTINDTIDGGANPFPNDLKYRIFVRPDGDLSLPEVLLVDSTEGATGPDDTFTEGGFFTHTLTLPDGSDLPDGVHDLKLVVEDRAGNISERTLTIQIDTVTPVATIDLIDSSDSGMFDDDDVTGIDQPAFAGISEIGATVTIFATPLDSVGNPTGDTVPVGVGTVGSDETDLVPDDGQGAWEVTVEPLDDGRYEITAYIEDLAGNNSQASMEIWVDTTDPNLPQIDLLSDSDTGHSSTDNITSDNTPDVSVTINDTVDGNGNPFPNDLKYRIYVRPDGDLGIDEVLLIDSSQLTVNQPDGFTEGGFFTHTLSLLLNDDDDGVIDGAPLPDGVHDLKLVVEDRAGNISERTLTIVIDTVLLSDPDSGIDLLDSSDTGMDDQDNVTSMESPAFTGISEAGAKVTIFAQPLDTDGNPVGDNVPVGVGVVGSDLTDFVLGNGLGVWEVTVEPMDDGVYIFTAFIEDKAGNTNEDDNGDLPSVQVEIDTIAPNTPFLDLVEASDSGRNNDDNITNDSTPAVTITTHDPNLAFHLLMPNLDTADPDDVLTDYLKFRIYDRFEESDEVLLYDSVLDAEVDGTDFAGDGFTSLTFITEVLPELADGIHNLKLEVEDRAGNISEDFLQNLLIDTVGFTGIGDLHPDSDSGVAGFTATMADMITNDKTPTFFGTAEANALVTVEVRNVSTGGAYIPAGTAIAVPLDGDDAFQPPNAPNDVVQGNWLIQTNLNLADGEWEARFTYVDPAGNDRDANGDLTQSFKSFFVDTQGPRVTDLDVNEADSDYDLFDLKPSQGPTPEVTSLVIHFEDLPERTASYLYDAVYEPLALDVGNYSLIGDHNGVVPISQINIIHDVVAGDPATAQVEIVFDAPLRDDRYTLIISDAISDVAGNALDGESNASGPLETPELPSGDGVPGGEFVARFTIDSRPEIATWSQGVVYADINGNFVWDPEGQDNDATNRDFVFNFGEITDAYFTGNFSDVASIGADNIQGTADDGLAPSNGFDKLGAYGSFSQTVTPTEVDYMFLLDTDDDGVGDTFGTMAYQVNAIPVAGNFFSSDADLAAIANGARPRDEIGAFDGTYWYLDTDGDNEIELGERFIVQGLPNGIPIVGDFNGDGSDDLATFDNDTGIFSFALIDPVDSYVGGPNVIGFDQIDPETLVNGVPFGFIFSGFGERPVSADVNLDGVDDLVMWVPDRDGQVPMASGEFHFLVSDRVDDNNAVTLPSSLFDPYSPEPLGNDLFAQFGDEFALPLIGNFDPPVAKGDDTDDDDSVSPLTNHSSPLDTNVDGSLTAADALVVINALPRSDSFDYSNLESLMATMGQNRLDANGDGVISAADALRVINGLARQVAQAEGESDAWAANVDGVIAMSDDDEDLLGVLALDQERDRVK